MRELRWIRAFAGMTCRVPSPQLRHCVHEALDARAVDRVPGVSVNLEMRADHHAVRDGEDVAHVVDGAAGVGEDGDVRDGFAYGFEVRAVDRISGQWPRDEDRIGKRREDGAFRAQGARLPV